jgi:hypothetical protein
MLKNLQKILFVILLSLPLTLLAEEFNQPILSATQVIERVLQHEKLDTKDVKVILLNFDYLQRKWHLELAPAYKSCLDCYPAYYIEDAQDPKIESVMHG